LSLSVRDKGIVLSERLPYRRTMATKTARDCPGAWIDDHCHPQTQNLLDSRSSKEQEILHRWRAEECGEADFCHFLAAGCHLVGRSAQAVIDRTDALPPVWRISSPGQDLVVDPISVRLTDTELETFRRSSSLVERLQTLDRDALLHMRVEDADRLPIPPIETAVRDWLEEDPVVGSELDVEGVRLTRLRQGKKRGHVAIVGPALSYWIGDLELDRRLQDRVLGRAAVAAEATYVIAAIAPPRVGLSGRCYSELLALRSDRIEELSLPSEHIRVPLFQAHPEVAAAMWIWRSSLGRWQLKAIRNASAARPVANAWLEAISGA